MYFIDIISVNFINCILISIGTSILINGDTYYINKNWMFIKYVLKVSVATILRNTSATDEQKTSNLN